MDYDFIVTKKDRIIYVSKDDYMEEHTTFPKDLPSNELIFQLPDGQDDVPYGTMFFDGKAYDVYTNFLRILPKGNHSQYEITRKRYTNGCIDICFQSDRKITDKPFMMNHIRNARIEELFRKAFTCWVTKNDGYYQESMGYIYRILAELQRDSYMPGEKYLKIRPAIEYIAAHFTEEKINMEELAAECGISYSYMKRLFIEMSGFPPQKYVTNMKMNSACDLLRTGDYSVETVAAMTGFGNIFYFSRQFKKQMGITPTEFIRNYRVRK